MNKTQRQTRDFHHAFDLPVNYSPTNRIPRDLLKLRIELIVEETAELIAAICMGDLVEIADGLADLDYVLDGTALTYGLDMEPIKDEVHRSNMSKGDPEPIYSLTGKLLKGENFSPPDIERIILEQIRRRRN